MENPSLKTGNFFDNLTGYFVRQAKTFSEKHEINLTYQELTAINIIGSRESCIMGDVVKFLKIPKNNMTVLTDRLEKDGLVIRKKSDKNRRITYLVLSDRGQELYYEYLEERLELAENLLSKLNQAERNTLLDLIDKVNELIEG